MKRILVFLIVGPVLGAAQFFIAVAIFVLAVPAAIHFLTVLSFAYKIGFVPAVIGAGIDGWLEGRISSGWRILAMMVIGAALAGLMTLLLVRIDQGRFDPGAMLVGVLAIIPAAVCAWLSGRQRGTAE